MLARRWLIALPLFLLAVAFAPLASAHATKANARSCGDTTHDDAICAPADRAAQPVSAPRVISVWGGARDSIALESDGSVWTWGLNSCDPYPFTSGPCGKLGDGTSIEQHVPVRVHGPGNVGYLTSVTAIMGGEHDNYALKSDGSVWAWGANFVGQLGSGDFVNTDVPVQVGFPVSVTMLGGRGYHNLALDMDGTIWAWGWNSQGQLGHDTSGQNCPGVLSGTTCSAVPIPVLGISHPLTVTGGGFFSLAVMPDHTVMAWGSNKYGQLGNGSYANQPSPVAVSAVLSHVVQLSAGWFHAVALTDDGHVWTWGDNAFGEIGNGVTSSQGISIPVEVPDLNNIVAVSGGDSFTGAQKGDGTVWTWGRNQFGQLGNASNVDHSSIPAQVFGLDHVAVYAARDYHNLAVKDDGTVWAWGSGQNGELGDNTNSDSNVPVRVLFAPPPPQWWLWLPLVAR
jgi:hypothetical protein